VQADHLPNGDRVQLSEDQPKLLNRSQASGGATVGNEADRLAT